MSEKSVSMFIWGLIGILVVLAAGAGVMAYGII